MRKKYLFILILLIVVAAVAGIYLYMKSGSEIGTMPESPTSVDSAAPPGDLEPNRSVNAIPVPEPGKDSGNKARVTENLKNETEKNKRGSSNPTVPLLQSKDSDTSRRK